MNLDLKKSLMMGEASLETSPKDNMMQDVINSDNMNSTESTIPNIFKMNSCCLVAQSV